MKRYRVVGYLSFRRLEKPKTDPRMRYTIGAAGETPRLFSTWREFGLWGMTVHFAGFYFCVIGPFGIQRNAGVSA